MRKKNPTSVSESSDNNMKNGGEPMFGETGVIICV